MAQSPWANLRQEYSRAGLSEADALTDPFAQLEAWLHQARDAGVAEPNAMTLATATADGIPSARVVLLKALDARGLVFYTNYESHKGRELAANPRAALVFAWVELERQVRVTGTVTKVSRAESAEYFATRPRGSQLGAWASAQSEVVSGRAELEAKLAATEARFADAEIPLPEAWGGYLLAPASIEFWQGRRSRMHDRLRYTRDGDAWRIERLSP